MYSVLKVSEEVRNRCPVIGSVCVLVQ